MNKYPENDWRNYFIHSDESMKYGLPEKKKYPMPDKDHVISAIKFFNYVSPSDEKELARNIIARIKEYGITGINVGKNNRFGKYYKPEQYLQHHGVKGQKWGVQNGPPYPLNRNEIKKAKGNSFDKSFYDKIDGKSSPYAGLNKSEKKKNETEFIRRMDIHPNESIDDYMKRITAEDSDAYNKYSKYITNNLIDWYWGKPKTKKYKALHKKYEELADKVYSSNNTRKQRDEYRSKMDKIMDDISKSAVKDIGFEVTPESISWVKGMIFWD